MPSSTRLTDKVVLVTGGSSGLGAAIAAAVKAEGGRPVVLDRQGPPDSLHATVSAGNAAVIDEYLTDLRACVGEVGVTATDDRSTSYASLE